MPRQEIFPFVEINDCPDDSLVFGGDALLNMVEDGRVTPFVVSLIAGVVRQYVDAVVWDRRMLAHFEYVVKESGRLRPDMKLRDLIWESAVRRLAGRLYDHRKNVDVRLCYRVDRNVFLAKRYFTFGQRTVHSGTRHVIRTTTAPVLYYQVPEVEQVPVTRGAGLFLPEEQCFYDRFVLQPNSRYVVPEGTTYLILAAKISLLGMYVVSADCRWIGDCKSPTADRRLQNDPFEETESSRLMKDRRKRSQHSMVASCKRPRLPDRFDYPLHEPDYPLHEPDYPLPDHQQLMPDHQQLMPDHQQLMPDHQQLMPDHQQPDCQQPANQQPANQQPDQPTAGPPTAIVFSFNPTRLVRGTYDYPFPDAPPAWVVTDRLFPKPNGATADEKPLDLTTRIDFDAVSVRIEDNDDFDLDAFIREMMEAANE